VDAISDVTDDAYTPWFEPYWAPDSTGESILFSLQAAMGALVIGYFLMPKADSPRCCERK
ncbi:MAG: energy-coupling factor ABC transporter substrate-binding protein, partial [Methanosarcinales archaeon]|nr:energy-coupling factor ABC transporter substrate-binding protein [Methanosarcinales archaeon]